MNSTNIHMLKSGKDYVLSSTRHVVGFRCPEIAKYVMEKKPNVKEVKGYLTKIPSKEYKKTLEPSLIKMGMCQEKLKYGISTYDALLCVHIHQEPEPVDQLVTTQTEHLYNIANRVMDEKTPMAIVFDLSYETKDKLVLSAAMLEPNV